MDKRYYEEYFTLEREHWWFRARADILMNIIRSWSGGRTDLNILNIGAATGHSSELLEEFGRVVSVEYDQECSDFTRKKLGMDIQVASILELPYDENSFDLVCAFDVIEHVEDDQLAVSEMKRVCRSDGVIFVTVPAFMFLWSRHDEVNHHFRRYKLNQLKRLFGKEGQFISASYFNSLLFFPIASYRLLSKMLPENKKRTDSGSDFFVMNKGTVLQTVLYRLFRSESPLLERGWRLPAGVSILCAWKRGTGLPFK